MWSRKRLLRCALHCGGLLGLPAVSSAWGGNRLHVPRLCSPWGRSEAGHPCDKLAVGRAAILRMPSALPTCSLSLRRPLPHGSRWQKRARQQVVPPHRCRHCQAVECLPSVALLV